MTNNKILLNKDLSQQSILDNLTKESASPVASWKRPLEQNDDVFSYVPTDKEGLDERTEREFAKMLRNQNQAIIKLDQQNKKTLDNLYRN